MNTTLNAEPVQESAPEPTGTSSNFAEPAKLGVNAAARLTGASKNTILKYLNDGTLSYELNAQGNKVVQVAELQRVFPAMKVQTSSQKRAVNQREPDKSGSNDNDTAVRIAILEGKNATLEAQLQAEKEKVRLMAEMAEDAKQNAEDWKLQAERATLILTDQRAAPAPQPEPVTPPKQGFFSKIFGGSR